MSVSFPAKSRSPGTRPGLLLSVYFYFREGNRVDMPLWRRLFLANKAFVLFLLPDSKDEILVFWGLTSDFAEVFGDFGL